DFKGNDSIERLWEKFLKYARAYTENDDLLLVYHMRYKEHITIPDKIGQPGTMRKNEMITEQPTLSHISRTDQLVLESFLNTWNKAVSSL
ncbi:8524_t:CDS:2, partial [Entrophospora sp. SA101]